MKESRACLITAGHPALAGHFPGNPLVPGVVVLDEVLRLAMAVAPECDIVGVDGVKFLRPILPQQQFTVHLAAERDERWRFECRSAGERVAIGQLLLGRSR